MNRMLCQKHCFIPCKWSFLAAFDNLL